MSYCLNPECQKPSDPGNAKFCIRCGTKLLLGDRYRSLNLISKSRHSRTLLAVDEDKPSKPQCIIKQFFPRSQGTDDPEEAAKLFQQKAVRLDELGTHPQIPSLLAHFIDNQHQYLVQEYIDGLNLDQELEVYGAFSENQIRQLLKDIVPVLQFVHERNVIHRDIKPNNIIRRISSTTRLSLESTPSDQEGQAPIRKGKLVLVDFSAAKFASSAGLPALGTIIGTAGYVAPEQSLGRGTYASDLYSLGITCIHLLTNLEPFELYSVTDASWSWREHLSNPVTDELGQILDKMLEYATKRRYQSAAEIIDDLNLLDTTAKASTVVLPLKSEQPSGEPSSEGLAIAQQPSIQLTLQAPATVQVAPTPQTDNWQCVQTLVEHSEKRSEWYSGVTSLAFSLDGQFLVSGNEDCTIKVWELSTGNQILALTGHSNFVNSIAFSPDGSILASAGGNIVKLWELSKGQEIRTFSGHAELIHSVAFSPDGQRLVSGSNDKTIKLWNAQTGEETLTLPGTNLIEAVCFSPDGYCVISGDWDNNIKVWNSNTGEEIRTLSGHSRKVRSIRFSPDGQTLVSGSSDKTLKIWQFESGEVLHTLTGHTGWFAGVNSVAISPDGQTLASGSEDRTIKLWNAATGAVITTLSGHSRGVSAVAFSPDGQTLASGSWDKTIKIWQCE
jgi:WD40 repeat protein